MPGTGLTFRQSASIGIVRGEQQQDLGLQRIGVLEFVDEDAREAVAGSSSRASRLSRIEIARLEQEIEEVDDARLGLGAGVAIDEAAEVALQERGEVGVDVHVELLERAPHLLDRLPDVVAAHAVAIPLAAALLDLRQLAMPRERDELRLEPVLVASRSRPRRA